MTSAIFHHRKHFVTIALVIFLIVTTPLSSQFIPTANAQTTHEVKISDFAFVPQNLTITSGDAIMWNNIDPVIHTLWFVYVANGSTYLLSDPISPDTTWTYTFDEAAELQYYSFDKLWITGFINVTAEAHYVAVTHVETFKTVCGKYFHPINIVFQNYSVSINATVENQGDYTETFDVTAKYDGNTIGTVEIILTAHNSTYVTFTWDTHGIAKDNYTISVVAELVGGNTCTDGWIVITWEGDFDGDFDVDEDDLWYFCARFIDYYKIHVKDPLCDFDDDCDIDEDDLWKFCAAFIDYWKA